MSLTVLPLTPDRWQDLETLFHARGCSAARGCWCMYYRRSGRPRDPIPGETQTERNRKDLHSLSDLNPAPGLIGYEGRLPVGWVSLGPREDYLKLAKSPVMRPVDEQAVWSVVCFVVPSEHRKRGVARALLAGAIAYAKAQGVQLLEAYPVDKTAPEGCEASWFGSKAMYDEAGFVEVARRKPARPVMRIRLG